MHSFTFFGLHNAHHQASVFSTPSGPKFSIYLLLVTMRNRNAKNAQVCTAWLQLCCDVVGSHMPASLVAPLPPSLSLSPLSTGQRNPCFGETMHTAEPEPSPHGTARTQHPSPASRWHGDILWCKQDASPCTDMKAYARLQGCRQESGEHCLMLEEKFLSWPISVAWGLCSDWKGIVLVLYWTKRLFCIYLVIRLRRRDALTTHNKKGHPNKSGFLRVWPIWQGVMAI